MRANKTRCACACGAEAEITAELDLWDDEGNMLADLATFPVCSHCVTRFAKSGAHLAPAMPTEPGALTVESIDGDISTREAAAEAIRQEMEARRAVTIADSRGGPPIVQLHAQRITVDFIDCEAVPTCIDGVMGYFSPLGFAARANWRAVCSESIQWIQGGADNRQGFRVRYHVFSTGDV